QGEKFDKDGSYVKKWVPELINVPKKYIHKPWETPPIIAKEANLELGTHYPKPIVDLKASRERALDAFQQLKG
ncbi:MAG TPA: deoxyribodipyrimidine photolyase, partial [Alteromonas australica]|nr:deoxyribodipyrimidine photolyase [Alteromonas australica]